MKYKDSTSGQSLMEIAQGLTPPPKIESLEHQLAKAHDVIAAQKKLLIIHKELEILFERTVQLQEDYITFLQGQLETAIEALKS
jgi:hypothetical protein